MHLTKKAGVGIAAAGALFWGLTGTALADGYGNGAAAAPADEGRKFTWSLTMAGTSDYIFRGISLSDEDPAFQPSVNFSYGILYFGLWGSNLTGDGFAPWETDIYGGIKPVLGPVTFDFGVVWYTYPGADKLGGSLGLDYVEFKAGASYSPIKNLTYTPVLWYTPDQGGHYSESFTTESTLAYALPACGIFTPTISGLLGWSTAANDDFFLGKTDDYVYWNAGLALAVEKFTFDFRYWDTDINDDLSDSRFVFSASVTLP
jgi:uncharacterized protein (TIGR02001 family)